jgi:CTP synthase (UTP-ammonia lyase)
MIPSKPNHLILIGERDPAKPAHVGIEASIALFNLNATTPLTYEWVATDAITPETVNDLLASATGIWCVPGSPYAHTEGALWAIRYARENQCAFLGTCGGFQHALMEFSRNVLHQASGHQEIDPTTPAPLIVQLSCSLSGTKAKIITEPSSWLREILGGTETVEEFNCNYGLATEFRPMFAGSAMQFIAHDEAGQERAFRLSSHPFFVGTLFQPERRALAGALHPLVRAFFYHLSSAI